MAGSAGRKVKLNPELRDKFLQALRIGATYELACQYSGISYQTFLNWKQRKERPFIEFFEDVSRAEGEAAVKWLALIEKHAVEDPKWAAWKLERRYPREYGRQVHEVTGDNGGALSVRLTWGDDGSTNVDPAATA